MFISRDVMELNEMAFLLDLLISRVIDDSEISNPVEFILRYRLGELTAVAVMDEVNQIADEVKQGNTVTGMNALERIGRYTPTATDPTQFVSSAFKVWSQETWTKIKDIP
jgi:hypothetical protein